MSSRKHKKALTSGNSPEPEIQTESINARTMFRRALRAMAPGQHQLQTVGCYRLATNTRFERA